MRQLAYDVFGGDDDLTETDLSPEEYAAAREIAINARKRQSDTISYKDYQTVPEGMKSVYDDPAYADVGGSIKGSQGVIKKSFNDPKYALKTTIGQARLTTNDKGETILEDQYNFNEKSWKDRSFSIEGVKTFLGDMSNVLKQPEYFGPRMLGSYLGSGPGEGSMVRINLGKLEY
jgi:hypothetical protein